MLRHRASVVALLPVFVLLGCGGGGGGGGGFPSIAATTADSMLRPFVTAAGELQLLDPAAPDSAPLVVDTGLDLPDHFNSGFDAFPFTSVSHIFDGDYDATQHAATGQHRRFAWYFKNGTPYRVDLLNTSSHEPVQFSSITDACGWNGMAIDYANPLNNRLAVQVAGDDTNCYTADDTARYISLGAATDDAGVTIDADLIFFEFVQATDGSLERVLAFNFTTGDLYSYAPDLSSPNLLMSTNPDEFLPGPDPSRTSQYYHAQPVGGLAGIYRYDATTDDLTLVRAYANDHPHFFNADHDYLYFTDGPSLLRVGHDSTAAEPLHTFEAAVILDDIAPTTNRLVFLLRDGMGLRSIESLPKSGGSTRIVLEAETTADLDLVATGGTRIYYNSTLDGGSDALQIGEAGAGKVTRSDARWAGVVSNPDSNIGALEVERLTRTLVLGEADAAGAISVRGVDARTGKEGPLLGTLPNAISGTVPNGSFGRYVLLNVLQGRPADGEDFDVYFADLAMAGSLREVAATPDLDDVAP